MLSSWNKDIIIFIIIIVVVVLRFPYCQIQTLFMWYLCIFSIANSHTQRYLKKKKTNKTFQEIIYTDNNADAKAYSFIFNDDI